MVLPATRLCLHLRLRLLRPPPIPLRSVPAAGGTAASRALHSNPPQPAKVVPVYGTGPPPEPPRPSPEYAAEERAEREERLARRRRQAEMLRYAGDIRAARQQQQSGKAKSDGAGLKRRFWKDVHVREVDGALEVHLDARPLRHPTTKTIIRLPPSKPHLAHALALEWDNLVSAQQATKQHLIPLTSLTCRALDIAADDEAAAAGAIRSSVAQTLLRYLDTDSLLCFAPSDAEQGRDHDPARDGALTLRQRQEAVYAETVAYLTSRLWPGVSIRPVLDDDAHTIVPRAQPPGTREVVHGWILSLSAWELAALERATLAGKSLLAAARLVSEWSEEGAGAGRNPHEITHPHDANNKSATTAKSTKTTTTVNAADNNNVKAETNQRPRFGVEQAARAVSLEVEWQTTRWGEVEDTHDVEREDLRRQLGSAVLLVSGTGDGAGPGTKTRTERTERNSKEV